MVPLKTIQGLSIPELQKLVKNRNVYIWGIGPLGREVHTSVCKSGIKVKAFLDSRNHLSGQQFNHCPIISPDEILNGRSAIENTFILIATAAFRVKAERVCVKAGFKKDSDFVSYLNIARPVAAVDVCGKCNLQCISCPQGNMKPLAGQEYMSLENYQKVLDKLLLDIPLLTHIELYTWGEPSLHPRIGEIIRITEQHVPCSISTNLNDITNLESIIQAEPTYLFITICGYEESYARAMPGASWSRLLKNLKILHQLFAASQAKTQLRIKAYAYQFVTEDFKQLLSNLGKELKIEVVFEQTYLNPYDKLLNQQQGTAIGEVAEFVIKQLPWNTSKAIALASEDIHLPCLPQRIFPIINSDLSVALCHVYYQPTIAENYLNISWDELLNKRHNQEQCLACQKHALHRLDLDILAKRYPKEIAKIYQ